MLFQILNFIPIWGVFCIFAVPFEIDGFYRK